MRCGICNRKMAWVGDTLLCLTCNWEEVYEYYGWVKKEIEK
jgi:hypothetical protein